MATVRHLGLFPFCVTDGGNLTDGEDYGAGTFYPIGVPLETALKWYWRVRRWRFELSMSISQVSASVDFEFQAYLNSPTEKHLVCSKDVSYDGFDGGFEQYGTRLFFDGDHGPLIKVKDLYYPFFEFSGALLNGVFSSAESAHQDDFVEGGQAFLDDMEVTTYLSPTIDGPTGQFNMTIGEYWPYDPGDGLGPIYDASTGEQLRAFPAF